MRFARHYTTSGVSPYASIDFRTATTEIRNPDGSVVFTLGDLVVPKAWSQVAADILAQKYLRKAGVAARLRRCREDGVPDWLWRSVPDETELAAVPAADRFGMESDARQVFDRLAGTWTYWGWKAGYFDTETDARAFHDEICYMLATQKGAPNSPQWFNTGLYWAYGIEGTSQGHSYVDYATGTLTTSASAYEHPQAHSCFIQSVEDDLIGETGILPLFVDETRIAKYGSGTGANFSNIRGAAEPLAGGGTACGLISVLRLGDRAAGLVTAKGSTRRASKMVVVDVDHPDIEEFVDWKVTEEQKVAALVAGSRICAQHLDAVVEACGEKHVPGEGRFDAEANPSLKRAMRAARKHHVPEGAIRRAVQFARQGYRKMPFDTYDTDWDSSAYATVAGQNANNAVRVTDDFLAAVEQGSTWDLRRRTDGGIARTLSARDLWDRIGHAAWASADPGLHYATTINDWHTCPAAGPINASNSCSEYLFLDNTGCTLASLNLLQFLDGSKKFDVDAFEHAARLWTVVLEISVTMAQYPSARIARLTYEYRTLGLGHANIGGLLMSSGIAYDSNEGRALCGAITALMTGVAYATSAEMARELGAFPAHAKNAAPMLRVMRNHRRAARGRQSGYEGVHKPPVPLVHADCGDKRLVQRAVAAWERAVELGRMHGYRNAQTTLIAPTGTIGLVMDCDTTGIEPDFALVKFKKLAGGGYFKIINRAVPEALRSLGYTEAAVERIVAYVVGSGTLRDAPKINHAKLKSLGFTDDELAALEAALPTAFDLRFVFNRNVLGEAFCVDALGLTAAALDEPGFDMLAAIGFSRSDIEAANMYCCGAMTIEGAPGLRDEHLPVFDCANPCGRLGKRTLSVEGHIRMMAAAQPYLSGAISKTVNMPHEASVEDCKAAYLLSWHLGLKANALYRDGSKLSQPLNSQVLASDDDRAQEIADDLAASSTSTHAKTTAVAVHMVEELRRRALDEARRLPGPRHLDALTASRPEPEVHVANHLASNFAVAISLGLQHGVPIDSFIAAFAQRGRNNGAAGGTAGKGASFVLDYVFGELAARAETTQGPPRMRRARDRQIGPMTMQARRSG
jgi:ribonucleoside-diphosphate reductase alpha chain